MSHPEKIYPINFAGFFDLKDEPYYEGKSLLNVEDYPEAGSFADQVCHRWNCHSELLEALKEALPGIEELNGEFQEGWDSTIKKIEDAISKANGL